MRRLPTTLLLMISLWAACKAAPTGRDATTVPEDGLLVDVSTAERSRVSTARVAHGRAKDDLAAAKLRHQQAQSEQASAHRQRSSAADRVEWAKTALTRAETTGTTADVAKAQQELETVQSANSMQVARGELRDREVIEAELQVALAAAHVNVAQAQLDLAKVIAVNTLERPDLQKPDVAVFEAVVRQAEGKENVARAGLAAASREVEIRRGEISERDRPRQ